LYKTNAAMITLFRRLRQKLISSGSLTKYLLYALGEILLVVLGILIALQINNWNEHQKRLLQETELLESFEVELGNTRGRLQNIVEYNLYTKEVIAELEEHLLDKRPYEARLDSMFFISTRFNFGDRFSTVALDNLNSYGIDIIRNKELRNQIILTYEAYPYLKEAQNIYTDIILSAGKDLLNTRFVELWDGDASNDDVTGTMHPLNYNELLTDQEFLYFLRSLPNHMVYFVERPVEYTLTRIESSLQMIESELNK